MDFKLWIFRFVKEVDKVDVVKLKNGDDEVMKRSGVKLELNVDFVKSEGINQVFVNNYECLTSAKVDLGFDAMQNNTTINDKSNFALALQNNTMLKELAVQGNSKCFFLH